MAGVSRAWRAGVAEAGRWRHLLGSASTTDMFGEIKREEEYQASDHYISKYASKEATYETVSS